MKTKMIKLERKILLCKILNIKFSKFHLSIEKIIDVSKIKFKSFVEENNQKVKIWLNIYSFSSSVLCLLDSRR